MLEAFNGQADTRTTALARLEERAAAGQLTAGAMFVADGSMTPAAALAGSSDLPTWEGTLGLPGWLAYAIDYCYSRQPTERILAMTRQLLEGIAPGADLSGKASGVVSEILASIVEEFGDRSDEVLPLFAACADIRQLHIQAMSGSQPSPAAWRAARKAATETTNLLQDPVVKALAGCIEAAAWDPVKAPTTVGDVLRLRGQVSEEHIDRLFGWTAEDDKRTRTLLAEMYETYIQDNPAEERDVFMLLREHHPDAEARLLAYTRFQNAERARAAEKANDVFLRAMKTLG
ncbi:hypothetical protein LXT13_26455 [Pelomonas sp. P8]|uniref:Uncharacterized protein n=2 Tax=Pelomonas cellulosilytica TaxID=2906762 RepID=A0ABS8XZ88_9BURK|nr:hypothetical protein [Pelomonas sp. P8]